MRNLSSSIDIAMKNLSQGKTFLVCCNDATLHPDPNLHLNSPRDLATSLSPPAPLLPSPSSSDAAVLPNLFLDFHFIVIVVINFHLIVVISIRLYDCIEC